LSVLPIYIYNQAVLRKKAKPVKSVNEELVKFAKDMLDTMHKANGIGLAANQVGSLQRVIVVDISDVVKEQENSGDIDADEIPTEARAPLVMFNPLVLQEEGKFVMEEGCLSIPDIREEVERAEAIQVKYKDLKMQERELFADGLFARVILHEIDHLNGVLFIDHLGKMKQKLLKGRLNKMRRGEIEVSYPIVIETAEDEKE
jgi:peptide deformylase